MSRALPAVLLAAPIVFGIAACEPVSSGDGAARELPNVVLIISDDQAWTDFGFMGHPHVRTPHLDRLAREGRTFRRGYVPTSMCRPSLTTILTGLHPHQHGIVGNNPPLPPSLRGRKPQNVQTHPEYIASRSTYIQHIDRVPTLPALLRARGYLSHQSGKWWEGDHRRGGFTHGMTHGDPERGGRHGDEGLKIGREGMRPVFEFIDMAAAKREPFFVYFAPLLPHTPHDPPERLLARYRALTPNPAIAQYWAMCEWLDETVGQLLDFLDERALARNTLVIFLSDNGFVNKKNYTGYDRRSKRTPYDAGVRTPIVLRWPGAIEPGDDTTLVSSIDIAPTILAAAGLPPTDRMQGIDLLDSERLAKRTTIFGEIFEHDVVDMDDPAAGLRYRWLIRGDWKLIVPNPARVPQGVVELYPVLDDPKEEVNVARGRPGLTKQLAEELDAWWDGRTAQP